MMNGDDQEPQGNGTEGSSFAGVSVRAWLALIVVSTVCIQQLSVAINNIIRGESVMIEEPLYSLSVAALAFYFGRKSDIK